MKKINPSVRNPGKKDIAMVHAALANLGFNLAPEEVSKAEMGSTTKAALSAIQRQAGLTARGNLTKETVENLNADLEHAHYAGNKTRTARIQDMLGRLGYTVDPGEVRGRVFGTSTEKGLRDFQKKTGAQDDGRLSDAVVSKLDTEVIKKRLKSKTQVGQIQRMLLRAGRIAKLDTKIDPSELNTKKIGPSSLALINAFQKKYGLPETRSLDPLTLERMTSVAASRPVPVKKLKAASGDGLAAVRGVLRLNMSNKRVGDLQKNLAFFGYRIDQKEFNSRSFGKTTREAVLAYQRDNGLPPTGHVEAATRASINSCLKRTNPSALGFEHSYRVRGAVRDDLWRGQPDLKVQVWEKQLRGTGTLLAERKTLDSGFFDVPYDPPRNPADGQIKTPFHLQIKVVGADNKEVFPSKVLFNPTLIAWTNFTAGTDPYRGTSEFGSRMKAIGKVLGTTPITDIQETDSAQEITHVAINAGLSPDDVMRLVLSHRAAATLKDPSITAEVFYAFIRQNLPPSLPGDLLGAAAAWTMIDQLVDLAVNGAVFMDGDLQAAAFDNAVKENLIPIEVARRKAAVLAALATKRQCFALEKPILIGNGSLQSLLNASRIAVQYHTAVADAFLECRGLDTEFWSKVKDRPGDFGGADAIADFETTVNLGYISKNHASTLSFLKQKIEDPNVTNINTARDLAKLTVSDWVGLIHENGDSIPDNVDGSTLDERMTACANMFAGQSEQLFPTVAFIAQAKRSAETGLISLAKLTELQRLSDGQSELDLRVTNLDLFVKEKDLSVPAEVLAEAKVMQRVLRLAPNAAVGTALLETRIHHSPAVLAKGKEGLVSLLAGKGIDRRAALTVFARAEFKYAQVLTRLADYRFELHHTDPKAIVRHTFSPQDEPELAGIANLEILFGSQDFCDCAHCRSVYGPAAYLADLLRFLDEMPSEQGGKMAGRFLLERRPDIGDVKLNCKNTDTPLPYIDLVCEVLERAVPTPSASAVLGIDTTLSKDELRAFPEYVRNDAYNVLKTAKFPIDVSLNLWQEEGRIFLQHLGVSRWELMEAFQSRPPSGTSGTPLPTDASVAGEYWRMSSQETEIVSHPAAFTQDQDSFWGFDTTRTKIGVLEFMDHCRIEYPELLDLLYVRWINPLSAADNVNLMRPAEDCSVRAQTLENLSADKFDRIHRFLRLWRRTGWDMWELDLLIRAAKIGNDGISEDTLVRLKQFRQLQEKLGLTFEQALSLCNEINTEVRSEPSEPQTKILPLYHRLFQNPAVINPVDSAFNLPLSGAANLIDHKTVLLGALAITEPDLELLVAETDGKLTLQNLTLMHNYAILTRSLKVPMKDLLALLGLTGIADVLASPKQTLDFLDIYQWVKSSGFSIQELTYLLSQDPESPFGLRDEVITQYAEALREALRSNPADQKAGQVASHVASTFTVTDELAQLLVANLDHGGALATHFEDERLTAKDSEDQYVTPITRQGFGSIFAAYEVLHKVTLLLKRYKVAERETLDWLLKNAGRFGLLNLNDLPVGAPPAQPLFTRWMALHRWLHVKSLFPQPEETSLASILDLAGDAATPFAQVRDAIHQLTTWPTSDLDELHMGLKLRQGAQSDYTDIETYLRLCKCFAQIKRVGVPASLMLGWAKRDEDLVDPITSPLGTQFVVAQQIKQAAKAKYDTATWLSTVTPFQDELREKKRTALTRYLIERSLRTEPQEVIFKGKRYPNPRLWKDSNDLLGYLLIDVDMSACMLTSRIKQAIGSVQMFVQRCFLNLEQPYVQVSQEEKEDQVSENSWGQWSWMKSYRIWEANRKVFLYPENWIEPELRDDKSPFFKEMENELMQNELTHDNAEVAFFSYLQKVHEVSHLDLAGVYHELDDDNPEDDTLPSINVLHVVGRTKSEPAVYYYRQFDLNYDTWSAWEKIDLDITGDHLTPAVYNRKLYLFWLVFQEKPQKVRKQPPAKSSDTPTTQPEAAKMLEIQLAWSARAGDGWTSRKMSKQKIIHPWERPLFSYNMKPRYKSRENLLWLDVYLSTSSEFNDARFYDPYKAKYEYMTAIRFDETARPWHSTSFVFDGDVVDVKLKPLAGLYHMITSDGVASEEPMNVDSLRYVQGNFGESGRALEALAGGYAVAPRLALPDGMHFHNVHLANNKACGNPNQLNVLENGATRTILQGAHHPFDLVFSQHTIQFDTALYAQGPLFYQDASRAFFIRPEWETFVIGYNRTFSRLRYIFYPFYHPYTALFLRELGRSGIDGLLNRRIQIYPHAYYPGNKFSFKDEYQPVGVSRLVSPDTLDSAAKDDSVDFSQYGAYAIYNWEVFFHAPLLIAWKLSQNQRFEEALRWFHYIFNPTSVEELAVPQRYWITKPFYTRNSEDYRKQRILELLKNIGANLEQVTAWKNNPFKPHLIARYRPVAYQKAVVMKYLDNLIAWGDQLFRQETIEHMNEATMVYVLAYELLGRRPVKVPPADRADCSYNDLVKSGGLDIFGNARVEVLLENFTGNPAEIVRTRKGAERLPRLDLFYFCIPNNDKLLGYWDTIEDRLFKIRHCMNIEGVVRQLPLFEPPIDPALLVKAAAAGVDLSSVLAVSAATLGQYRFRTLAQKALEFTADVKALGDKILSALEKRDGEGLALLRSVHEIALLESVREVRKKQIEEAQEAWAGLETAVEMAQERKSYYDGKVLMSPLEIVSAALATGSIAITAYLALSEYMAAVFHAAPSFNIGVSGVGGSAHVTTSWGTENIARCMQAVSSGTQHIGSALSQASSLVGTIAGYEHRKEEWDFQGRLAKIEIEQLTKQVAGAQVRYAIAEKELANHELQVEQGKSTDEYMRSKYTNQQLYDWMLAQLATIYFQSYQIAYDMAKRAEKCFQLELAKPNATFIQFGYWDSLKKGLLSGERLGNDLHRMEASYLEQNTRELELTKHISLAQFFPDKLLELRINGTCTIRLPEWLFDMDYCGHYRRRIKSVSLTIPCVVGPYTGVNCTLSLVQNRVRVTNDVSGDYGDPWNWTGGDARFVANLVPVTSMIATSTAQNDAGMFELNFNDERNLPFEGAGAVSEWVLSLPAENNLFDVTTVSDVILHIRYTTVSGGPNLATAAKANLNTVLPGSGLRLFILNHEFGSEWYRFFHPDAAADQVLAFTLKPEHLPFYARNKTALLTGVEMFVESTYGGNSFDVSLQIPGGGAASDKELKKDPAYNGMHHMQKEVPASGKPVLGEWKIKIKKEEAQTFREMQETDVQNAYLLIWFKLQ